MWDYIRKIFYKIWYHATYYFVRMREIIYQRSGPIVYHISVETPGTENETHTYDPSNDPSNDSSGEILSILSKNAPEKTLSDSSRETSNDSLEETLSDSPGETLSDSPGETLSGSPGETLSDSPGETLSGSPGETLSDSPGETLSGSPGEISNVPSDETLSDLPEETLSDLPEDKIVRFEQSLSMLFYYYFHNIIGKCMKTEAHHSKLMYKIKVRYKDNFFLIICHASLDELSDLINKKKLDEILSTHAKRKGMVSFIENNQVIDIDLKTLDNTHKILSHANSIGMLNYRVSLEMILRAYGYNPSQCLIRTPFPVSKKSYNVKDILLGDIYHSIN